MSLKEIFINKVKGPSPLRGTNENHYLAATRASDVSRSVGAPESSFTCQTSCASWRVPVACRRRRIVTCRGVECSCCLAITAVGGGVSLVQVCSAAVAYRWRRCVVQLLPPLAKDRHMHRCRMQLFPILLENFHLYRCVVQLLPSLLLEDCHQYRCVVQPFLSLQESLHLYRCVAQLLPSLQEGFHLYRCVV